MSWVRILRTVVLVSIAVGAALGIVALVVGDLGETGWKIVGTSFLITATALVAMPSVAAWERDRLGPLPLTGVAASVLGFGWLIAGMWAEADSEVLWKIPTTLVLYGIAVGAFSLVEFARLAPPHRWLIVAARLTISVVAAMLVVALWGEIDSDGYWRAFGVAAILMTAFLASLPVLHRSQPASAATTAYCPACGVTNEASEGVATRCRGCGVTYTVDLVGFGAPAPIS